MKNKNSRLVSGSWDNGIRLFERESGSCIAQSDHLHNGPISKVHITIIFHVFQKSDYLPQSLFFATGDLERGKVLDTFVVKGFSCEEIGHHKL